MKMQWRNAVTIAVIAAALSLAATSRAGAEPEGSGQWEFRGGNPENHQFSALRQIDELSVQKLGLAWSADLPSADGPVGTPIVVDGVIYTIGTLNMVYAHDVRSGALLWVFDPHLRFSEVRVLPNWGMRITRGVAYADGRVFQNTGDCRLVAIDARKGTKIWEAQVCPADTDYTITSAPRVGGGMVFVGPNNADYGTQRGYVDAYDAQTGRRLWRFHTVPGLPSDRSASSVQIAAKTWDPVFLANAAGGSVWEDITYDPVTGLVFLSVGGAAPWNPLDRGSKRGDELFTNSIVALEAKTGKYVWHYQVTPGDGWNLEPAGPKILADLKIDGRKHRVLMDAPKNGFFYVLDVRTGKLLNQPRNFAPVNWAKEIDAKSGRPVPNPEAEYWNKEEGAVVYPSPLGAHNWIPMSFSRQTGLVYIPSVHHAARMQVDRTASSFGGPIITDVLYGLKDVRWPLVAWDPIRQAARWSTDGSVRAGGGVLSTAGNLVFQGSADGLVRAYRATDGALLWKFETGGSIIAAPVTVAVNGVQMLLVVSGSGGTSAMVRAYPQLFLQPGVDGPPRLFAFALNRHAAVPPFAATVPMPKPPLPRPDPAVAKSGCMLFDQACELCHGARAQAVPGSVPDLRRASAATHAAFDVLVRGGVLRTRGMPRFGDLSEGELKALQACVLDRAWEAYELEDLGAAP